MSFFIYFLNIYFYFFILMASIGTKSRDDKPDRPTLHLARKKRVGLACPA